MAIHKLFFVRILLLSPCTALAAQDLLIECKTLAIAPDVVVSPGAFLVRDGKVAFLGQEIPAEARAKARTLAWPTATIVPGFVLAHSTLWPGAGSCRTRSRDDPRTAGCGCV